MKIICDGRILDRQIGIAIENEKFIAEFRQRASDGSAGAEQILADEGIIQFDNKKFHHRTHAESLSPRNPMHKTQRRRIPRAFNISN